MHTYIYLIHSLVMSWSSRNQTTLPLMQICSLEIILVDTLILLMRGIWQIGKKQKIVFAYSTKFYYLKC